MQISQKQGIRTLNQSLAILTANNQISLDDAVARCTDYDELVSLLQKAGMKI